MSRFGAAFAADPDAERAARRAAHGALGRVAGPPDLVVVAAALADPDSADHVAAAVADQVAATGNERCAVIGATAEGIMGESSLGDAAEDDGMPGRGRTSVAVWAARLPGTRVRPFRLHSHRVSRPFQGDLAGAANTATMAVGGLPEPWPDERVALLFADPYSFPVDGFLARCNTLLPRLPFVGGLAPGPAGYGSARLMLGAEAYATGAVGVLLGGEVQAAIAVSQGCRAIGPAMTVTAAEGDMLLGLAGRPAYRRLREILAEQPAEIRAQASSGLHLGIALNEYVDEHESGDFLIRGVVGLDPETDGIRVGDHVEVGQTVRFQVRDAASAADQLRTVLRAARARPGYGTIGGALLVSCNGRAAGLFPPPFGAGHDLHTVCSELGTAAVAGFFGTGEIGPVGGRNHLHGYTASVLAFADGE